MTADRCSRCRRVARPDSALCADCFRKVVTGADTTPAPPARPGPPTGAVGPMVPWSELELRYRFGDR